MGQNINRELIFSVTRNDLAIDYYSGSGAGGQYRNKHQNCVRMFHKDSGVRVTGQSQRNREANLREAFLNLSKHPKFKAWLSGKAAGLGEEKDLAKQVEEMMAPDKLKVEYQENGTWVPERKPKVPLKCAFIPGNVMACFVNGYIKS